MATDLENLQSANSDSYTVDSVLIGEERLKLAYRIPSKTFFETIKSFF